MTTTRHRWIWLLRIVVVSLFVATVIGVSIGLEVDPCAQNSQVIRLALLLVPVVLFISLVALGAAASDSRREPWIAFGFASLMALVYLPLLLIEMILWDSGC